jgi:hypothetical protein
MGKFIVHDFVPNFDGNEFYLPAENGLEVEAFYKAEQITTLCRPIGGKPAIAVRAKRFVKLCRPGDEVRLTIESVERKNGIGIRSVSLEVI